MVGTAEYQRKSECIINNSTLPQVSSGVCELAVQKEGQIRVTIAYVNASQSHTQKGGMKPFNWVMSMKNMGASSVRRLTGVRKLLAAMSGAIRGPLKNGSLFPDPCRIFFERIEICVHFVSYYFNQPL